MWRRRRRRSGQPFTRFGVGDETIPFVRALRDERPNVTSKCVEQGVHRVVEMEALARTTMSRSHKNRCQTRTRVPHERPRILPMLS